MSKTRWRGDKVLIMGDAYDVNKTVDALHRLVCAYMDASGESNAIVASQHPKYPPAKLPVLGFEIAEGVWKNMTRVCDVVDEPLLYAVGTVTFKAYLLGKEWAVYRPESDDVVMANGNPPTAMNNVPVIFVHGARSSGGSSLLLPPATMEIVERSARAVGLPIKRVDFGIPQVRVAEDRTLLGVITLPHDVYGAGHRELAVRCVLANGAEVSSADAHKPN